jgi:NAD(P)-dependent dehydrogenase (short-subunit alcohol dehydrogenase family)
MNTDPRSVADLAGTYAAQIKGKVVLCTGVSPGTMGAAFVEGIACASPALLILAGRNVAKTQQTADAITAAAAQQQQQQQGKRTEAVAVRTLELDLGSLASVRAAAAQVNGWADMPRLDVLVNNAGVMAIEWSPSSPEGYDGQFVTNHLGHFLFTNLVMPKLLQSPAPRVVNISSNGHRLSPVRFEDWNFQVSGLVCKPAKQSDSFLLPFALFLISPSSS